MTHYDWLKQQPEFHSGPTVVVAKLNLLYPPFMAAIVQLMKISHERGWPFEVFETFRSAQRQVYVQGQGYSQMVKTGPHNFGLACDIVPHIPGRKDANGHDAPWCWDAKAGPWSKMGAAAGDLGLVWGGKWKKFYDGAHVQCIVNDQKLYTRIREGLYYPDWEPAYAKATAGEPADTKPIESEPQQIVLYRELYDAAADMPQDKRQKFLRTLNTIRPYVSEEKPDAA